MEPEGTRQSRLHWINADKSNNIHLNKNKGGKNRGVSLFFSIPYDIGAAGIAVVLLKVAWRIWEKARFKFLAIIPLLLGGYCAFVVFYLLAMIWREGFYSF